MKFEIFAIEDKATKIFDKPFYMLTKAEAIRAFTKEANNPESMFFQHPHDYHLYYLGQFFQDVGTFDQDTVTDLGSAKQYQNPDNVENIKGAK